MQHLVFVLSISLAGQAAPTRAPAPSPTKVKSQTQAAPTHADIYRAYGKAIGDARARAAGVKPQLREAAFLSNCEDARKALCKQFKISVDELDVIVEEGKSKDAAPAQGSEKRAQILAAKKAQKMKNLQALGDMQNQINAQAALMAADAAARQPRLSTADLSKEAAATNAQLRFNTWRNGYSTLGRPNFSGPN